jgi:hypothetical protein
MSLNFIKDKAYSVLHFWLWSITSNKNKWGYTFVSIVSYIVLFCFSLLQRKNTYCFNHCYLPYYNYGRCTKISKTNFTHFSVILAFQLNVWFVYRHRYLVEQEMLSYASGILGQSLMDNMAGKNAIRREAMEAFLNSARY